MVSQGPGMAFILKVMGKHLMGGVGAREPDPAQELPLPWPKQPHHQLQGRGWQTLFHSHPAPFPCPRLLSSDSMYLA